MFKKKEQNNGENIYYAPEMMYCYNNYAKFSECGHYFSKGHVFPNIYQRWDRSKEFIFDAPFFYRSHLSKINSKRFMKGKMIYLAGRDINEEKTIYK